MYNHNQHHRGRLCFRPILLLRTIGVYRAVPPRLGVAWLVFHPRPAPLHWMSYCRCGPERKCCTKICSKNEMIKVVVLFSPTCFQTQPKRCPGTVVGVSSFHQTPLHTRGGCCSTWLSATAVQLSCLPNVMLDCADVTRVTVCLLWYHPVNCQSRTVCI